MAKTIVEGRYSHSHMWFVCRLSPLTALPERFGRMACIAGAAKGAAVRIIAAMTSKAGCRYRHFLNYRRTMAGAARKVLVRAREHEHRLFVVIEDPALKAVRIVTSGAG